MEVNLNPQTQQTPPAAKSCGACGATDRKLMQCAKCKFQMYCSRECQKKHWPTHKKVCVQPKAQETNLNPFSLSEFLSGYKSATFFTSQPSNAPVLNEAQISDAKKLIEFPLNSILDQGETKARCKALGQAFFDKYKKLANSDSFAGKIAVQDICDWLITNCSDGKLRKQYVEYAWDGIGDENWQWMH